MMSGAAASPFASIAVIMPVHAYASSSAMMTPSSAPRPAPPADSGTCVFTSPSSHAALKMSCGKAIERSYSRARGSITSRAKERASDCTASWSGESAKQRPGAAAVESARRAAAAARSIVARAGWGRGVRVGGARGARRGVEVRGLFVRTADTKTNTP
jgi:hypothetical protein